MDTRPDIRTTRYDVVIAGARCAGAATALLLARAGLRVLAVDPLPRGRDTLSTHALMRGGVLQLHRWGVLDAVLAAGTPAIRTTSFHYGDDEVRVPIKPADGVDALYAPRRTVLDPILGDAAREAGAEVVHAVSLVDVVRDRHGRVRGARLVDGERREVEVAAGLVVGADGIRSRVARSVGAEVRHAGTHAAAAVYGYWRDLPPDGNHWHYLEGVGVGIIPTNDGESCVFAGLASDAFAAARGEGLEAVHHATLAAASPGLAERVAAAPRSGRVRAFAGAPGFVRRSVGPGWALVGDAGYFRDPITAHGITDALLDAEALARALCAGEDRALAAWEEARDARALEMMELSDRIASFAWDMDEIRALHLALSRAMKAEVVGLADEPAIAGPVAFAGMAGAPRG